MQAGHLTRACSSSLFCNQMRAYNLDIAGYKIRLEAADDGPGLEPSARFLRNIIHGDECDVTIKVHHGKGCIPEGADRVFVAPFVVEIKGVKVNRRENFWSVYRNGSEMYVATSYPAESLKKAALLKFSMLLREWDLWIEGDESSSDPLEYPLDGLILYYLTVISGDIMIHASGINISGRGYLFSGVSGRGKTTIAKIWDKAGARIIHDDRLILKNSGGGYRMFNTPVYDDDEPLDSPLDRIFIIEHGVRNNIIPVKGASAVTHVIANCIQHNWDPELIARFLGSVSIMCTSVPVARLAFTPDRRCIDYILEND